MTVHQVMSKRFDLGNHSINRAIKQDLLFHLLPIGFFGHGPNLKFCLKFWWLHHGYACWQWMKVRLEDLLNHH